jgi:gliding motility-associated lipoprotein GldD
MKKILILVIPLILIAACQKKDVPKPRGYFRIEFPQKSYNDYENQHFRCEVAKYSFVLVEKNNPDWLYITEPKHKATIYLTYLNINKKNTIDTLLENSRQFAYKHTIKADAITETKYINDSVKVYGMLYDIKGNVASSIQFFVTDSVTHFLRGSLYFECRPNKDSLASSIAFFRQDIVKIMETIRWK